MDPILGEIRIFAGDYAPEGWAICDGRALNITGNEALYSLISTTYGGTATTFLLPDLRGRLPIGQGAGTNLSTRAMGQSGGAEQVQLVAANTPAHTHTLGVSTATANLAAPTATSYLGTLAANALGYIPSNTPGITTAPLNASSLTTDGGSNRAHDNMMPTAVISYIICLQGLYPEFPQ